MRLSLLALFTPLPPALARALTATPKNLPLPDSDLSARASDLAVVDPSMFVPLANNFEITAETVTREYTFDITNAKASPDGFTRNMYAINGILPGPLIEGNQGDTVVVHVNNYLDQGQGIHWHGLRQNGTGHMDGVPGITQCPIPANGGSYTYQFTLDKQAGTYWYHSHFGNTMADGLGGPIVIHSPDEGVQAGRDYDEERIVWVTEWLHDDSETIIEGLKSSEGYRGSIAPPQGDAVLINGVGQTNCTNTDNPSCFSTSPPEIQVPTNSRIRIRFISAAAHAMFRMSLDTHELEVVETDGTPVWGPTVHEVPLAPGERYSVIIDTNGKTEGDSVWLRATTALACMPGGKDQVGLAVLRYGSGSTGNETIGGLPNTTAWGDLSADQAPCRGLDQYESLSPRENIGADNYALTTQVLNSERGSFLDHDGNTFDGQGFNNISYQNQINDPLLSILHSGGSRNTSLVANVSFPHIGPGNIIINNLDSNIDHPYHVHGNEFQTLARGEGSLTAEDVDGGKVGLWLDNPVRKDTLWIPGGQWALLRIITDNPGVHAVHCHIGWHLAEGKLAVVIVQPDAIKNQNFPSAWYNLCDGTDPDEFGPSRRTLSAPTTEPRSLFTPLTKIRSNLSLDGLKRRMILLRGEKEI
ncbi:hypothetical protein L202_08415 [Cryptococcus amylolentus CBS 6039]|uniref:Uncharacterized protein n=2 Tax=Cryptococcus amylolentus TaxID=104669 RepID=A0A1E3H9M0_9TREE|nr:hypothetical protein L202_08415 [Cryptococcus amylolentus CBS 6039]ODN73020.1 hypothetical protein L202_08415 [Cryptococcus amylolentus CBS 6039]ODN98173.1 hypothetical protein I350_07819 [Cryptococcus amylolentus CBS 6273]